MNDLKKLIREIPDFPKPGILFYDITTLLKDAAGFRAVIDGLKTHYEDAGVDLVIGIEARGFIFAPEVQPGSRRVDLVRRKRTLVSLELLDPR